MTNLETRSLIQQELPLLLRTDPEIRRWVEDLVRDTGKRQFADREQTESRFDRALAELREMRMESERRWQESKKEQDQKWQEYREEQAVYRKEQNQKWQAYQEEQAKYRKEQNQKWQESKEDQDQKWQEHKEEQAEYRKEQNQKWQACQEEQAAYRKEQNQKWQESKEDQDQKWQEHKEEQAEYREEQNQKWQKSDEQFSLLHEEIKTQGRRHDRAIGALGARWGIQSEKAFRDALAGILEENFGVQVLNVNEFDDEGTVFGRPDQVELDIIVKNGMLLICELKSSIDKGGLYTFERKARFYEKKHQRKATRLIVITPMLDPRAKGVAEKLGIDWYGDSLDVKTLDPDE